MKQIDLNSLHTLRLAELGKMLDFPSERKYGKYFSFSYLAFRLCLQHYFPVIIFSSTYINHKNELINGATPISSHPTDNGPTKQTLSEWWVSRTQERQRKVNKSF